MYLDKLDGRITPDEYDKLYKQFRAKIDEIDSRLTNLQKAEDEYYITANYLLQLANRAYDLFVSSEIEEKRQLLKMALRNLGALAIASWVARSTSPEEARFLL